MKRIKGLLKIIAVLIIPILLVSANNVSFAANDFWLNLYAGGNGRPTATNGYYVTTEGGNEKPVIKIIKTTGQSSNNESSIGNNSALYCLDNSKPVGIISGTTTQAQNYTKSYNLRDANLDATAKSYISSNSTTFKKLMWLLDNIGLPNDTSGKSINALLSKAGIDIEEFKKYTKNGGIASNQENVKTDLIEIAQQSAIWHILKTGEYQPTSPASFRIKQGNDISYYYGDFNDPATELYKYLIGNLISSMPSNYDYTKSGNNPLTFSKGFNKDATATISGTNYLVGPFLIENTGTSNYALSAEVPNGGTIVDKNGKAITGNDNNAKIENAIKNKTEFYISIPVSGAPEKVTFKVTPSFVERNLEYRLTGTDSSKCQPVVLITDTPKSSTASAEIPLTPPTVDLALRKFITGVTDSKGNSKTIDNISGRTPTVDSSSLEPTGSTNTTAEYKHRKDPVKVEKGDLVKYTLRVYNEGGTKGLATKITDQLPTGLTYKSIETSNYTASTSDNKVVLTRNNENNPLDEFTKGSSPKYEEIKITCEVTADAGSTSKILTNIAWISEEYNAVTKEKFTTEGKDRDSAPATAPSYSNDWKGTVDTDKNQNEQKYYKGQQDDDDFEKLIMDPGDETLDLALRKYIATISKTDLYSAAVLERTVEVDESPLKNGTGTTAIYKHAKNPITVNTGDKILYCLTIFNEGSVEGRATKITDQLPTGIVLDETVEKPIIAENFELDAYNKDSNQITLKRKEGNNTNLPAYTPGSLDGTGTIDGTETIGIVCEVKAETDENNDKVLTNIAWISEEVNGKTGEVITNQENKDRDSVPVTHPTYSNDWKGTVDTDKDQNEQKYYKGQQDDDDFEKVVLKPKDNQFDLALRKFISAVDGKTVSGRLAEVEEAERRKLGTDTASLDNGTTAEKNSEKTPYEVNADSIVTFTIRVYNEGQVDGHATEITDYIPEGLEFVTGTANNNKWTYDQSTRKATTTQIATTTIKAFDTTTNTLDYQDIKIDCKVNGNGKNFKNIAAITKEDGKDRDSQPTDINPSNYNPKNPTKGLGEQDDDDYDEVKLPDLYFDLALRKYITEINGNKVSPSREPSVDAASLKNGTSPLDSGRTATKTHTKNPLSASKGDKVKYTIKIYNEGNVNGTATKIVDYLPEGLKLVENSETNRKYGWVPDNSGKAVMTTYLSDKNISAFDGSKISSDYVEIECEVIGDGFTSKQLKNVAEIIESKNDANIKKDRDSDPNNVQEKGNNYNAKYSTQGRGYEDDDDYEDLLITRFDLALRKFITGVNNEVIANREPTVDTSKMGTMGADGKEITTFTYSQTKDPVKVEQNDVVIYTLRVYNEGNVNAYAETIKDDIPEGLEFLPDHEINNAYGWTLQDESGKATTDISKAKFVVTDFRSKAKTEILEGGIFTPYTSDDKNIINAYNPETMKEGPDYIDVQVAFKVTQPVESDRIVINKAQISKHSDENGNTNIKDIDSTPDVWNEGEDDQDIEKIYVKYFDLALRKWVTHAIVIEDGVQKEMETGHTADDNPESVVKIEINKKRLEDTVVKFRYSIKIINEGEIAGAATEISDYIPNGLKFNQADNPKWRESNGKVITDQLKDTMLQPGEEATVDILLTWENSDSNMGVLKNVAEISADYNESGTPDINSTPNNKKEGENDIDEAPVALTVVAGSAPTYIAIASGITLIIGGGIFFIKKYVI